MMALRQNWVSGLLTLLVMVGFGLVGVTTSPRIAVRDAPLAAAPLAASDIEEEREQSGSEEETEGSGTTSTATNRRPQRRHVARPAPAPLLTVLPPRPILCRAHERALPPRVSPRRLHAECQRIQR